MYCSPETSRTPANNFLAKSEIIAELEDLWWFKMADTWLNLLYFF